MLLKWTPILLISIAMASCHQRACTEIGCEDGLVIDFDLEPMSTAVIVLNAESKDGVSETYELRCGFQAEACPELFTFNEFTVEEMEVEIWRDSTLLNAYKQPIEYETFEPNGPGCDPQCLQASVTVTD